RHAVNAFRHAACSGNFRRHLGARQDAAMAGFGALADLDFDHLDLRINRLLGKALRTESAILIAAAKIPRANFPDQIAAMLAVITTDTTLTRILGKTAIRGTLVHRQDGIG